MPVQKAIRQTECLLVASKISAGVVFHAPHRKVYYSESMKIAHKIVARGAY